MIHRDLNVVKTDLGPFAKPKKQEGKVFSINIIKVFLNNALIQVFLTGVILQVVGSQEEAKQGLTVLKNKAKNQLN